MSRMDDITTEMAELVCDRLCKYPEILSEEELEEKCSACEMGDHICHILNEYNRVAENKANLDKKKIDCKQTNFDICCQSVENMAQVIDIAKCGWTKEQVIEWLQSEVEG